MKTTSKSHGQSITLSSLILATSILASACAISNAKLGQQYEKEGKWDEAVSAFRLAVKEDPYDKDLLAQLDSVKKRAADQHYSQGRQYLKENAIPEALNELKVALSLDPSRREHQAAMNDVLQLKYGREQFLAGQKLQSLGRLDEALAAYEQAVELDPNHAQALSSITQVMMQIEAMKPVGDSSHPITLRFQNASLKEVFEVVARTAGVNVLFDKEVSDEPITIFIKDMPFNEALRLILSTNGMFSQRVSANTLLIIPNTKQKQAQYQDLMIRTFYLSHAKAKDTLNLVRTMLESKHVYVDEKVNALVVREEPGKLRLAERVINSIDRPEPEVELDLEVLEVDRTKSLKYGMNFAKSAGAGIVPPGFTGALSTGPTQFTLEQLTALNPQSYLFTIPASIFLDFFKQESDAKTLAAPKLRVINNKSASINVGDKQPILLSTTNVLPGQAATGAVPTTSTVTSIEFKDVGVKLTVEPTIHLLDELTLKIKVEVTRLGDQVILQTSPEIKQFRFGTRAAETFLMLKDDETVILGGLIQDDERRTKSKVPWLDSIPLLGKLFSGTTEDTVTTEVVVTITPHIVRKLNTPSVGAQAFWSGTESNYATTPYFALPVAASTGTTTRMASVPKPVVPPAPLLTLMPGDLSAKTGQEFRLDLTGPLQNNLLGSIVHVAFDAQSIQFLRAVGGKARVSTSAGSGQVDIAIQARESSDTSNQPIATLFFQANAPGNSTISLRQPNQPEQGQPVTIHVQ